MLQIVTGMYFRTGVRVNSTVHRAVLYTNRGFLGTDEIELPVGKLLPSTGFQPVPTVTVSVTEHLEAVLPDGTNDIRIASGGTELIEDLADVLSFALNAVFSRHHDLVHRLVPDSLAHRGRSSASSQLRGTFDPLLSVTDAEVEDVREFMTRLLALRRPEFEAAIMAIRRIVRAWQKIADDPTIAYTDSSRPSSRCRPRTTPYQRRRDRTLTDGSARSSTGPSKASMKARRRRSGKR